MKVLLVGPYFEGSTTKMRGEALQLLLKPTLFRIVNVDIPQKGLHRIVTSIGWRYKFGPMVVAINKYIKAQIAQDDYYDFVWIEKGVYINYKNIVAIREKAKILMHYTPDTAFLHNKSRYFRKAIPLYDFLFTTKSFEIELYKKYNAKYISFVTQGYDANIHKPYHTYTEKDGVVFIGQYHKDREIVLQLLLDNNIKVKLAGVGWEKFVLKNRGNIFLSYAGTEILGVAYATMISSAKYSIGLLAKIFPEKHTTRTFEIPACGTALISETNSEIEQYLRKEEDFIAYTTLEEIVEKIKFYESQPDALKRVIQNGYNKVMALGLSHQDIVQSILQQIKMIA